jgi:amino acid permease
MLPNEQFGRLTIWSRYLYIGITVIGIIAEIAQYFYLEKNPYAYDPLAMTSIHDWIESIVGLVSLIIIIFAAIVYIIWFRRAYINLKQTGVQTEYESWWTIGGWIIPIVAFFVPYKIMVELHVKTGKLLEEQR